MFDKLDGASCRPWRSPLSNMFPALFELLIFLLLASNGSMYAFKLPYGFSAVLNKRYDDVDQRNGDGDFGAGGSKSEVADLDLGLTW